jgi:hypothetical protein
LRLGPAQLRRRNTPILAVASGKTKRIATSVVSKNQKVEPVLTLAQSLARNYSDNTGQLYSGRLLVFLATGGRLPRSRKLCRWKLWLYAATINLPESYAMG